VLARFLAPPELARRVADLEGEAGVNTDDRNMLEFSIARALGRDQDFTIEEVQRGAAALGNTRPKLTGKTADRIDWNKVADAESSMGVAELDPPRAATNFPASESANSRMRALKAWLRGDLGTVTRLWESQEKAPDNLVELTVVADGYASLADERALPLIAKLAPTLPVDADVISARYHYAKNERPKAWELLRKSFAAYEVDPWPHLLLMERAVTLANNIAQVDADPREQIFDSLMRSFVVNVHQDLRRQGALDVSIHLLDADRCARAVAAFGRHFPWEKHALEQRLKCYGLSKHAGLAMAERELSLFLDDSGVGFGKDLAK
jgi:hypothetical protein